MGFRMKEETKEIKLLQTLRQMMSMINKQAKEIQTLEDTNKKLQEEINYLKYLNSKNQEIPDSKPKITLQEPQTNPYTNNNININVYA